MTPFIRYIMLALIPIILNIIFNRIGNKNSKNIIKNQTNEHITIQTPKAFLWIGIIGSLFCSICIYFLIFPNKIFIPVGKHLWWVCIIFVSFDLLGIYIIFNTLVWKIEIFQNKDYFLYKPLFKTYKIKYEDCLWFLIKDNGVLVIKTNTKTVNANTFFTNYGFLPAMLIKHKIKQLQEEPKNKKTKK